MARKETKDHRGKEGKVSCALWGACIILLITCLGLLGFICWYNPPVEVVYKCPPGQVTVLEDAGLPTEAIRCYTPGVSYTDFRSFSSESVDGY